MLPRVRELEQRFPDALTVIGVHAGKYPAERHTERVAAACDRLGVQHAVVNDRQFRIWKQYAISAWPTVALIGADGMLVGAQPGEFSVEAMAEAIAATVAAADARGILRRGPDPIAMPQPRHEGPLRFPGRAALRGDRLWIADSGHGRVLECALDATGASPRAQVIAEHGDFAEPQGLAFLGDAAYVADRLGHSIWRLTSDGGRERVAGTGTLAESRPVAGPGPDTQLRSPWGLASAGGALMIAMAGSHQLWRLDPSSLHLSAWAGTGGEDIVDGPLGRSLLAQPTGVVAYKGGVAFSDSESSSVRLADELEGVRTLVGTGLFDFGDRDGVGDEVRLQHAEDVAVHDGALAVVDTYNGRLKRVDALTRDARAWQGEAGEVGALSEPAGVSGDGSLLVVADTGNHRIVLVADDGTIREVRLT